MPRSWYNLCTYPAAYMAYIIEAALGERAFTECICSSYSYGGFCVAPAGQCSSAKLPEVSESMRDVIWEGWKAWRENGKPVWSANMRKETQWMKTARTIQMMAGNECVRGKAIMHAYIAESNRVEAKQRKMWKAIRSLLSDCAELDTYAILARMQSHWSIGHALQAANHRISEAYHYAS
jgi:hypothetical protein